MFSIVLLHKLLPLSFLLIYPWEAIFYFSQVFGNFEQDNDYNLNLNKGSLPFLGCLFIEKHLSRVWSLKFNTAMS